MLSFAGIQFRAVCSWLEAKYRGKEKRKIPTHTQTHTLVIQSDQLPGKARTVHVKALYHGL